MRNCTDTFACDRLTAILISRFYFALDDLQAQQFTTTLPSVLDTTLQFAASKITVSFANCFVLGNLSLTILPDAGRHTFGG